MKLKSIIGIVLILVSVCLMYVWETGLRDRLLLTEVVVAAKDISEGEFADESCFKTVSVTPESLIAGAVTPAQAETLCGTVCMRPLAENSQINASWFMNKDELDKEGSFTMLIPSEWISLKNEELMPGDSVSIYCMPEKIFMGSFPVKLTDPEEDRFVEIQCMLEDYFSIYDVLRSDEKCSLLLVSGRSL